MLADNFLGNKLRNATFCVPLTQSEKLRRPPCELQTPGNWEDNNRWLTAGEELRDVNASEDFCITIQAVSRVVVLRPSG
jgi:hypothetical protein